MPHKHRWIAAWLPLVMTVGAWAAEPNPSVVRAEPDPIAPALSFDLKSESVRKLVRATASTQVRTDYRVENSKQLKPEPDLAAALHIDRPAPTKTAAPRLPDRPPPCDGFWSCGIETVLGLEDFDDEVYGRVERNRLMNQGSFTNTSNTGPLRPK